MAYVTDADLKSAVADVLKQSSASLPTYADAQVARANVRGYSEVVRRLAARGFTPAQIDAWDDRAEFNRDLGIYWFLVECANIQAADLWPIKFDRREELKTVPVTTNGVIVAPAASASGIGYGEISRSDDTFSMDVNW